MTPRIRGLLTLAALAAAAGGGYWLGTRGLATTLDALRRSPLVGSSATSVLPAIADPPSRPAEPVVYYRHPDGTPRYSLGPETTADGRRYVPVYANEDVRFDGESTTAAPPAPAGRRILYYRNPMGLPDVSPAPKKDGMGMDYLPVYEGEATDDSGTVTISPERVQRSGVRTERVGRRIVTRPVVVPGSVSIDEGRVKAVTLRAEGFIEELFVNRTGQSVKSGQPLFRVYMPQLQSAQVDLLLVRGESARSAADGQRLIDGAAQKLRNLGVPDSFIRMVAESRTNIRTIDWPSPMSGIVLEKRVVDGQRVMPGDELYRIADLSTVWVIAQVPEHDIASVKTGDRATVTFRAYPGEDRQGKVAFIYPDLKPETRTARIRIELPNADGRLRADMYADVALRDAGDLEPVIAVPDSAVIENGQRRVVLVARGEGRFEPRPVKTGRRGEGYVEITRGVKADEEVVTAATFLIDAESNLKAALRGFQAPAAMP